MPANSLIVGVDLAPIKPIPRTITFQSDITTDKCRATIRQHFKTWKADTVLHDGAPNVGTAWVQDAFSQAELALQALKLATEFLVEGGTFVTKVFRSKDYNALLWAFNQLFTKVEATKPPSSRSVSAEIFVVCRGFKAPKRMDPKFLDPRSVFAELSDPTPNNEAKVFNPEVKKRKRDGYEEGNYTQFKEAFASEFIQTTDPIAMLGSLNKLTFEQPSSGDIALAALDKLPETTTEIRESCTDLKVLGRKEFRTLLKWRLRAREIFGLVSKKKVQEDTAVEDVTEIEPIDEELQMQEDLQRLTETESARKKRERRRENQRKQKEITRMQLHMLPPTEIGLEQSGPNGEDSMFALAGVNRAGAIEKITKGKMGVVIASGQQPEVEGGTDKESDDEEDELDRELDMLYNHYHERRSESDAKYRAKKTRREHNDGDWEGFSDHEQNSGEEFEQDQDSTSSEEGGEEAASSRGIATATATTRKDENGLTKRASLFFEQDIFKDVGILDAEEGGDSAIHLEDHETDSGASSSFAEAASGGRNESSIRAAPPINSSPPAKVKEESILLIEGKRLGTESCTPAVYGTGEKDNLEADFEVIQNTTSEWDRQGEPRRDGRLDIDIITAEAMSLAQQIASGEKSTYDLVDEGFNKFTFQDRDGLPEWFLDDENKHNKPHRPITAAGAAAIKEKLRALNARPIKKVREAKDRKKFKAAQRLERLRKKSASLASEEGISEKHKAQNIAKLMSKAAKKKPKQQTKVVVAIGGNRGISGRPRGVKGKYKIVDARLKKDVRAEKRLAKKRH